MWSSDAGLPILPPTVSVDTTSATFVPVSSWLPGGCGSIQAGQTGRGSASMAFTRKHLVSLQLLRGFLWFVSHWPGSVPWPLLDPREAPRQAFSSSQICGGRNQGEGQWDWLSDWLTPQVNKYPTTAANKLNTAPAGLRLSTLQPPRISSLLVGRPGWKECSDGLPSSRTSPGGYQSPVFHHCSAIRALNVPGQTNLLFD